MAAGGRDAWLCDTTCAVVRHAANTHTMTARAAVCSSAGPQHGRAAARVLQQGPRLSKLSKPVAINSRHTLLSNAQPKLNPAQAAASTTAAMPSQAKPSQARGVETQTKVQHCDREKGAQHTCGPSPSPMMPPAHTLMPASLTASRVSRRSWYLRLVVTWGGGEAKGTGVVSFPDDFLPFHR